MLYFDYIIPMKKINAEWHLTHKMPKNPSLDQRVNWHREHVKNCQCRPMPGTILVELKRRNKEN